MSKVRQMPDVQAVLIQIRIFEIIYTFLFIKVEVLFISYYALTEKKKQ